MTQKLTKSQIVMRSVAKTKAAGGRKLTVVLQPAAAQALRELRESDYAPSIAGVVTRALLEARKK